MRESCCSCVGMDQMLDYDLQESFDPSTHRHWDRFLEPLRMMTLSFLNFLIVLLRFLL